MLTKLCKCHSADAWLYSSSHLNGVLCQLQQCTSKISAKDRVNCCQITVASTPAAMLIAVAAEHKCCKTHHGAVELHRRQ